MLSLLRTELEKLFRSLTAEGLDRMAYQIWRKKNDEYEEWCKQALKNGNQDDRFFLQKPNISLLRTEIGNALKYLSADELDQMAYETWKKKHEIYHECFKEEGKEKMPFFA